MALKVAERLSRRGLALQRLMSSQPTPGAAAAPPKHDFSVIGKREIVGFGRNGNEVYFDVAPWPFPAIRYREEDSAIKPIREKEKGDWKQLTLEEKKALYRFSFCQTFAEMDAPTAEWKYLTGWVLIALSVSYAVFILLGKLMPTPPVVELLNDYEHRLASLQRRLDLGSFPDRDFGPYWDKEKRDWKDGKVPPFTL